MRLYPSLLIVGLLSLQLFAEDGRTFANSDSARVTFTWTVISDTITVTIGNTSTDPVENFFLSDFTDSQAIFIECWIDGVPIDSLPTELEFGSVYPNRYTTRWIIGDFSQSLELKYYSAQYNGNLLSWSAGHPYAIFGIISRIGAATDVIWIQGQ